MHASPQLLFSEYCEPPSGEPNSLNQLENLGKSFKTKKTERKSVFYLLIAAAILYNLFLAFSEKDGPEQIQHDNKELTLSPKLK